MGLLFSSVIKEIFDVKGILSLWYTLTDVYSSFSRYSN